MILCPIIAIIVSDCNYLTIGAAALCNCVFCMWLMITESVKRWRIIFIYNVYVDSFGFSSVCSDRFHLACSACRLYSTPIPYRHIKRVRKDEAYNIEI